MESAKAAEVYGLISTLSGTTGTFKMSKICCVE